MQIQEVRNSIIEALSPLDITVKKYLGELSTSKEPELLQNELPIIFVDFKGDVADGFLRKLKFNLYFVHITFSSNSKYREKTSQELEEILQRSEELLYKVNNIDITTKSSKKIFDAKTDRGYLTIFSRDIEATISNTQNTGENL
jgi:hypothetical protein